MDESRLRELITQGEDQTIEFKKSTGQLNRAVETVAAFGNTDGGHVLIGVRKDGTIEGVQIGANTREQVVNKITANTNPGIYPSFEAVQVGQRSVIVVSVDELPNKPYSAFGRFFKRVGPNTVQMDRAELERLLLQRRSVPFDQVRVEQASYEDIDERKVLAYLQRRVEEDPRASFPTSSVPEVLTTTLHAAQEIEDRLVPTTAGILLFGKEPQRFLPQAEIRLVRFKGTTRTDVIDEMRTQDTLLEMLDEAEKFARRNTRRAMKVIGFESVRIDEYPFKAIREAVVNAVAHRNYEAPGYIQVNIFDDRLEVQSPGEPLKPIKELEGIHLPRNSIICRRLHDVGEMEEYGTGLAKMKKWMRDYGLPEPVFESRAGFFRVTFHGPGDQLLDLVPEEGVMDLREIGLNERQIEALRQMVNERRVLVTDEYSRLFGISRATAYRDLNDLVGRGLVVRRGRGRSTSYEAG
ncbi:MAG: helix-turn-helix domain-containing protein [Anaerolineae bacterium]